jgi:hypothetical protein
MRSAFSPAGWLAVGGVLCLGLLGPCSGAAAAASAPDETPISLELNKLAPIAEGAGCRAYFVISNPGAQAMSDLDLDLVLFNTEGIIARRMAVQFGPVPAQKTVVRLFDLAGTPCDSIGHILLNDVLSCQAGATAPGGDSRAACLARITVSSLAKAKLTR